MDLEEASGGSALLGRRLPTASWVEPLVDADPAALTADRESVRLAFVAALQLLPPRQRAVLILRDVLRWRTDEVATLLDASEASVKSALQRARATLAANRAAPSSPVDPALLHRYLDAFSRFDVDTLVRLLRDDAVLSMPPYSLWLSGAADIAAWLARAGGECRDSVFEPAVVNGTWGARQLKSLVDGGRPEPFAVHALEADGRQIVSMHIFLEPR
jgi:RNA polymerase sigma-70 factor (ECF subfamily)